MTENTAESEPRTERDEQTVEIPTLVPDEGDKPFVREMENPDADDHLRLRESELDALREYDRVLTTSWRGRNVLVEMIPDEPNEEIVEVDP